jgi:hypothetical protein
MPYDKPLPPIRKLQKLAEWSGPFPMKCYRILIGANLYNFDADTIEFLKLFPHDGIFLSREDFVQRCELLEEHIRAENARLSKQTYILQTHAT